jgi:glyoxylase-like metal-dependent hydrolase (beta-lactamase superfamily II)
MNSADQTLYDHLDVQAQWLGLPPPDRTPIDADAREGDRLTVGPTELTVLETPGHTRGSVSLWIPTENKLVAGDTLFRESIGRTDLPGGDGRQILESIREKLLTAPEQTVVIPGHGPLTTIAHELEFNPYLENL